MKNSILIGLLFAFVSAMHPAFGQSDAATSDSQSLDTEKVEVYYFHNTRRCATCEAVEQVTKETLEAAYPEQMKQGNMTFQSLNIEEDENEPLARQLGVSGQTLLIVKGDKKKDLTNDAFMYARTNPDKLKEKIQKAIDKL